MKYFLLLTSLFFLSCATPKKVMRNCERVVSSDNIYVCEEVK